MSIPKELTGAVAAKDDHFRLISACNRIVEENIKLSNALIALSKAARNQLNELSQHQTCTKCGCGVDEPESVALRAAIDKLEGEI